MSLEEVQALTEEYWNEGLKLCEQDNQELLLGRLLMLNTKIKRDENVFENTLQILIIGQVMQEATNEIKRSSKKV